MNWRERRQGFPWHVFWLYVLLAAGIGGAGRLYYQRQEHNFREAARSQLSAIAEMKVSQFLSWRRERIDDGELLGRYPVTSDGVRQLLAGSPKAGIPRPARDLLELFRVTYGYESLLVVDRQGRVRLSLPRGIRKLGPGCAAAATEVIRLRKATLSDLHRDDNHTQAHLCVGIPVASADRTAAPAGVLLLGVDPGRFLYPLIQRWPTPSPSAETLLVRREGHEVLFLNELRHRRNTALTLRLPLETKNLVASMAVQGQEGVVEGGDYRNVAVVAAVRRIPDTPWFLVAKVDAEEVYGPLRERAWWVALVVGLLIATTGTTLGFLWRHQRASFYRRQFEMEQRYRTIVHAAMDGLWTADAEGRFREVNDAYCKLTGYSREELLSMRVQDVEAQETALETAQHIARVREAGSDRFETRHRRKDGSILELEVSVSYLAHGGGTFVGFGRDISERRRREEERELTVRLLRLTNSPSHLHRLMRETIALLRDELECDAVGIRLREGEDFPYFESNGFGPDFVLAENTLCARDPKGELVRDSQGNPVLECMCGNVLCGRFDAAKPFFTADGSFWTNSTTELLASTTEADRLARTRNRCHGEGYESVALFPLRLAETTFGLLQVNHLGKGFFTPEKIALLEGLADNLAVALAHRQATGELRESEARLRNVLDTAPVCIWEEDFSAVRARMRELSASGVTDFRAYFENVPASIEELAGLVKVTDVNQEGVRYFQVQSAEASARHLPAYFLEESWPVFREELAALAEGRTEFAAEIPIRTLRGERRELALRLAIPPGFEQTWSRVLVTFIDITERKRAEERLRESEERYRRLFEQSGDLVLVLELRDGPPLILDANQTALEVYGYSREEMVGQPVSLVEPDITQELIEERKRLLAERKPMYMRHRRKDGSVFDVESVVVPVRMGEQEVVLAVERDITERKRAEEALRDSQAALAQSREELRGLAGRLLTAQEEERRRVARELHDDLNQRLAILAMRVDTLRTGPPLPVGRLRQELESLGAQVVALSEDVHRMASQLHPSVVEHLGLAVALRSHCAELSSLEGIPVAFEERDLPEAFSPEVAVCLFRIAQEALRNVSRHARATRAGVALAGDGTSVALMITDNGVGFDPQAARSCGGLGLLSMEERIRLVGGTLAISSSPGQGTRVEARVPWPKAAG